MADIYLRPTDQVRVFTVRKRADNAPITSGTVNYYLFASSGANAGKWYRSSDQTWQASETANAMSHLFDGAWQVVLGSPPFSDGLRFIEYVKESGNLHVPQSNLIHGHYLAAVDSTNRVTVGTNADKTGYSLSSSQTFDLTGDITGNLSGSVGSVTGDVGGDVVGSVGSVTGNVGGNVVGSVGSVTGNVGGNVVGSVGSLSGVTFPTNFGDLSITATTGRVTVGSIVTDAITAAAVKADAVTKIQSGLATSSAQTTAQNDLDTITGADGVILATSQANYAPAKAGDEMDLVDAPNATAVDAIQNGLATSAALATVDSNVDQILEDTGTTLPAAISALNNLSTSDVDARLAAIGLDHLVSAAVAGTDIADNSIIAKLVSKSATADWDSFNNTTDSLEALRERGDAAWITATGFSTHSESDVVTAMQAVADDFKADVSGLLTTTGFTNALPTNFADLDITAATGRVTVGTSTDKTGYSLSSSQTFNLLGNITGFLSGSVGSVIGAVGSVNAGVTLAASQPNYAPATADALATVDAVVDAIKLKTDNLPASPAAASDIPTAGSIADAVWDESTTGHTNSGTFGSQAKTVLDTAAADVAGLDGAAMRGTDNAYTGTPPTAAQIRQEIDSNSTQLAAIVEDTNELQTDWKDGGRLDLILDARASQTTLSGLVATVGAAGAGLTEAGGTGDHLTAINLPDQTMNITGNLSGSVGSLGAQAKADVNAEVLDVLATDTFAELAAVPSATSSLKDKIVWLFMLARNKLTQSSTTSTLHNDADSANVATASTSDDGSTFTRGEWS